MKIIYDVIDLNDGIVGVAKLKIPDEVYKSAFTGDRDVQWPEEGADLIEVDFIWKEEGAREDFLMSFVLPTSRDWVREYSERKVVKNIFGEYENYESIRPY